MSIFKDWKIGRLKIPFIVLGLLFIISPMVLGYGPKPVTLGEVGDSLDSMRVEIAADYVPVTGGEFTGDVVLPGYSADSTEPDSAYATLGYVDSHGSTDTTRWSMYMSSGQSLADDRWDPAEWDRTEYSYGLTKIDTTVFYGVIVADSGVYDVSARFRIDLILNQAGRISIAIAVNSTIVRYGNSMFVSNAVAGSSVNNGPSVTSDIWCDIGDTITIQIYQSGASGGGTTSTGATECYFTGHKIPQ
jgi:hypothetical protein